ncbi:UNVERIFIED_CONTAM: hypothetical protein FKN15_041536 [Acipenser sinensis]
MMVMKARLSQLSSSNQIAASQGFILIPGMMVQRLNNIYSSINKPCHESQ